MTASKSGNGPSHSASGPRGRDELGYQLRQQSLLADFGRAAMQTRDLRMILQKATELCASGLQAQFAKVLEFEPDEERLTVRAGVGWKEDTIDVVPLAADVGSSAGYAYRTGESVISNHLEAETRFRTPQLLTDHGVRRAINVLTEMGAEGEAYFGVLEVDRPVPVGSTRQTPISSPVSPACSAWRSNANRRTPSFRRRSDTRGC